MNDDAAAAGDADSDGPEVEISVEAAAWTVLENAATLTNRAAAAAASAAGISPSQISLSVLLCDDAAIQALNQRFRQVDAPTNVLAWPAFSLDCPMNSSAFEAVADASAEGGRLFMGDIALAFETTSLEAARDAKPLEDHFTHLIVHAVLHLFGYDHDIETHAEVMEQCERVALADLGVPDPYAIGQPMAGGADSG